MTDCFIICAASCCHFLFLFLFFFFGNTGKPVSALCIMSAISAINILASMINIGIFNSLSPVLKYLIIPYLSCIYCSYPNIYRYLRPSASLMASCPVQYSFHGAMPSAAQRCSLLISHFRCECSVFLPICDNIIFILPISDFQTCQICCSQRRSIIDRKSVV